MPPQTSTITGEVTTELQPMGHVQQPTQVMVEVVDPKRVQSTLQPLRIASKILKHLMFMDLIQTSIHTKTHPPIITTSEIMELRKLAMNSVLKVVVALKVEKTVAKEVAMSDHFILTTVSVSIR
mmetsp:Transcript_4302/g.6432  ORF Transcript_4302/g.6432 Transcript_4302/m.6432 type:complete len:124 (+) Transcript_4302:3-374(+)